MTVTSGEAVLKRRPPKRSTVAAAVTPVSPCPEGTTEAADVIYSGGEQEGLVQDGRKRQREQGGVFLSGRGREGHSDRRGEGTCYCVVSP